MFDFDISFFLYVSYKIVAYKHVAPSSKCFTDVSFSFFGEVFIKDEMGRVA